MIYGISLVHAIPLVANRFTGTRSTIGANNTGSVKGTWISAQASADQVSIPVSSVDEKTNVHFKVNTDIGELAVMAYRFDNKIFVRSNVCPPCNSIGFTLEKSILVCDSCGLLFDAATGAGIGGECVPFPKESIFYMVSDDKITMKLDDIVAAHEKTTEPINTIEVF